MDLQQYFYSSLCMQAIIELLARGLLLARAKLAALQHEGTVQHKDLECLQSLEQQVGACSGRCMIIFCYWHEASSQGAHAALNQ